MNRSRKSFQVVSVHVGQPLRIPLAVAVVSGVPALVLVSVGPVAQVAGPGSILVWSLSAFIGLLIAIPFGTLVSAHPEIQGGVAAASARVMRPHSQRAAVLVQWSYWLGWSPALGISATLIVQVLEAAFLPSLPAFLAWLMAVGLMLCAATVNQFGLRTCAWVQAVLAAVCVAAVASLIFGPLTDGTFDSERLLPTAGLQSDLPGGLLLLCGSLFLAGWSAYGAEVALSYAPDYRRGSRDLIRSLMIVAILVILIYSVVPALLIGGFGIDVWVDPVSALLSQDGSALVRAAALIALPLSVVLTLNMISVSGSRVLSQMAREGDVWHRLGHVNGRGVPRNALYFDVGMNAMFLGCGLVLSKGQLVNVPVTLLTSANVAYFVSLILALVACAIWRWSSMGAAGTRRLRSRFAIGCLMLAGVNAGLLLAAAAVWGSTNVALGAVVLVISFGLLASKRTRARVPKGTNGLPDGKGQGCRLCPSAHERVAQGSTLVDARARHGGRVLE